MADLVEEQDPGGQTESTGMSTAGLREGWEAYEGVSGLSPDAFQHLLQGQGVNPVLRQQGRKVSL